MSNLKEVLGGPINRWTRDHYSGDTERTGCVLTPDQAREALAAIESRDAIVAALVSQAKETAYRIAMHIYRDREGQQELAMKHAHDFWQDYLTEPARAVLVQAGKITEE